MHTRITNLATLTAVSYVIVKMKMEKAMSIKRLQYKFTRYVATLTSLSYVSRIMKTGGTSSSRCFIMAKGIVSIRLYLPYGTTYLKYIKHQAWQRCRKFILMRMVPHTFEGWE